MRKIDCPYGGWIGLPDEWLGIHARRRDEAITKAIEAKLPTVFTNFAASMAMLEDWGELPGVGSNAQAWDFNAFKWPVMAWVTNQVGKDIADALKVSKSS